MLTRLSWMSRVRLAVEVGGMAGQGALALPRESPPSARVMVTTTWVAPARARLEAEFRSVTTTRAVALARRG